MPLWMIDHSHTRFCIEAMKANHGWWDIELGVWTFRSEQDAANALSCLYRATRATANQRETLERMIADGIAATAWGLDPDCDPTEWLKAVSRDDASRLIADGIAASRVVGRCSDDRPLDIASDQFDVSAFERGLEARRARVRTAKN